MKHLILFFIIIIGVLAIRLMTINTREDFLFFKKEEYIHPNASIKYSDVGGRGVFSNKNYHIGEIIEICPAIKTKEDLVKEINILVDKKNRNFINTLNFNTLSDEEQEKLDFLNEVLNRYILVTSSKPKVDGGKRKSRRKRNKRRKTNRKKRLI